MIVAHLPFDSAFFPHRILDLPRFIIQFMDISCIAWLFLWLQWPRGRGAEKKNDNNLSIYWLTIDGVWGCEKYRAQPKKVVLLFHYLNE